jgi:hypothetical protein
LQSGELDGVLHRLFLAGGLGPPSEAIFSPDARGHKVFRPPFSCPPYQTGDHVDNRTLSVRGRVRSGIKPAGVRHAEESLRHLVSGRRYHKRAQSAAKFLGAIGTAGRKPAYRRDAQELRKERTALLSSS